MEKKALIITGNLVQDHEFIYPYYRLKEKGYSVTIALKDAKPCMGILGTKIPPDEGCKIIPYEHLLNIDYDLLVLPGGVKCIEKLRQEKGVLEFIQKWDSRGKTIASICHGAQLLISSKIIKGRKISGYYSIKDDITNAGAEYVDAPYVTDKNVISSPHYKYLGEWMSETFRVIDRQNDSAN